MHKCVTDARIPKGKLFRTGPWWGVWSEKGMVTDFGSMSTISDQREQVTDQDTNHSRAMAVTRPCDIGDIGKRISEVSGPVQLGQAQTRSCGKIPACFASGSKSDTSLSPPETEGVLNLDVVILTHEG
jgi:hypothetical protein